MQHLLTKNKKSLECGYYGHGALSVAIITTFIVLRKRLSSLLSTGKVMGAHSLYW